MPVIIIYHPSLEVTQQNGQRAFTARLPRRASQKKGGVASQVVPVTYEESQSCHESRTQLGMRFLYFLFFGEFMGDSPGDYKAQGCLGCWLLDCQVEGCLGKRGWIVGTSSGNLEKFSVEKQWENSHFLGTTPCKWWCCSPPLLRLKRWLIHPFASFPSKTEVHSHSLLFFPGAFSGSILLRWGLSPRKPTVFAWLMKRGWMWLITQWNITSKNGGGFWLGPW